MSYSIKILPEAKEDIKESVSWYENQQQGLGTKFFQNTINAVKQIGKNPFLFQIGYNSVRLPTINSFPFCIHYTIEEDQELLVILAALHTSRNPMIWLERKL